MSIQEHISKRGTNRLAIWRVRSPDGSYRVGRGGLHMSGHTPHFGHVKQRLEFNSARWPCDKCGAEPENLVVILRGGYVQEQLCPGCYTDKYPEEEKPNE